MKYANRTQSQHQMGWPKSMSDYGKQILIALLETGYVDWYEWSIANWGTKWDACSSSIDPNNLSMYWETTWSPTIDIVKKLSKQTGLTIFYRFSKEQFDVYGGEYIIDNGVITMKNEPESGSKEIFKIATAMTDHNQEEYRWDNLKQELACSHYENYENDYAKFEQIPKIDIQSNILKEFQK